MYDQLVARMVVFGDYYGEARAIALALLSDDLAPHRSPTTVLP